MIVFEGRSNEMKKSMAVILLGSALLLPNNHSAEASSNNSEGVQKAQNVQCYVYKGKYSYNVNGSNFDMNTYLKNWDKFFGDKVEYQKPAKPDNTKPVENAKPSKPSKGEQENSAEQQKPSTDKPVADQKPVDQKPIEQKPVQQKPVEEQKPSTEKPAQNNSISAIEKAVLDLTNAERAKAGLKPLEIDNSLMNSARQKSKDMASNNYFSHTSPTYGSPFDQMKANGITYRSAAENIAMGQRNAEEVVKAWMESPGHRQNILTPSFTHIGIGYDANGNYWTQQFIQK